jgi:hypothetical protein
LVTPWPSAGVFLLVAPVASVGVDGVGAEDFAGELVDDCDGGLVGDGEDAAVCVAGADAEVVHAAGAAEADLAVVVGSVVAQPVVAGVADGGGWSRFRCGGVGDRGGEPLQCPVGSKLVADALEAVELGLQLGDGGGRWLGCEPALQGLVEAFDLALGLRIVGMAVLLRDAQVGDQVFEAVAAASEPGCVDRAVEFLTDVKLRWGS